MENILIDTDVVIEYLRAKDKASTALIKLLTRFNVFISSITEFELFLGAVTDRHIKDIEMIFKEIDVIPFDFGCGRIAASIFSQLRKEHQHAEIKDIFIAAIAIRNNLRLCTFNRKHFQSIPVVALWEQGSDLPLS